MKEKKDWLVHDTFVLTELKKIRQDTELVLLETEETKRALKYRSWWHTFLGIINGR